MSDPELYLAVTACRAAYRDDPIDRLFPPVRWERLLKLVRRHRVEALVWHGLGDHREAAPTDIAGQFAAASRKTVDVNLRAAAECARLLEKFHLAGVDLLFLKGLTLGALAYPNPMLKMGWDIDLLVAPERIGDAARLLKESGYRLEVPSDDGPRGLKRWHQTRKESVWYRPEDKLTIDLHSSLADNPRLLRGVGLGSPRQMVRVAPAIELPTLARTELFAYLCVHGASSAWFRLKWICDLAALLHRETPETVSDLYRQSKRLGAGRSVDQALLLAGRMFGIDVPDELQRQLDSSLIGHWLAKVAEAELTQPDEPTERPLGTAMIHLSQPFLLPGSRFMFGEIMRQARSILAAKSG